MKTRRKLSLALLVIVALLTLGLVGMSLTSGGPGETSLADGRLAPCPPTPNCVCSEGDSESGAIEALHFPGNPDASFASLLAFLKAEPRTELVDSSASYAHFVVTTRLMRFSDDLELRLDAETQTIQVRSASRVGQSDLGANRARVESIRARWTPPLPPPAAASDKEALSVTHE